MKQTRAQRFRIIRDEVLRHHKRMSAPSPDMRRLTCGPFTISLYFPGTCGPLRGWNLNIWPDAAIDCGIKVHGDKVCNVDWDQHDNVYITTFRSGPWEEELLRLLRGEGNLSWFGYCTGRR